MTPRTDTVYDADFRIVIRRTDPVHGPRVAVVDTMLERAYVVRPVDAAAEPWPASWRAEVADRFDPDELHEFEAALDKVAARPAPGEIGGSGRLTRRERELVAHAQRLALITPETRMWRPIAPEHVEHYLSGRWTAVYGAVLRRQDVPPATEPACAIEFRAGAPERYRIPFGAPYGGGSGRSASDPAVRRAGDAMWAAVRSVGLDPSGCVRTDGEWPYDGIGTRAGVPERLLHGPKYFEDGDTMVRCATDGPVVLARFDGRAGRWVARP